LKKALSTPLPMRCGTRFFRNSFFVPWKSVPLLPAARCIVFKHANFERAATESKEIFRHSRNTAAMLLFLWLVLAAALLVMTPGSSDAVTFS